MAKAKSSPAETPEEAAGVARVALVAVEPIRHDGADLAPGETFDADRAVAEALLASGAAAFDAAEEPLRAPSGLTASR